MSANLIFLKSAERMDNILGNIISQRHILDALNALSILEEHNAGKTLTELALEFCRKGNFPDRTGPPITLEKLFIRYQATLSPDQKRYKDGHRWTANVFCGKLGPDKPVENITADDVRAVLSSYAATASYNSLLARFRAVVRWGYRQHLLSDCSATDIEPMKERWREPAYFMPDKVEQIMRQAQLGNSAESAQIGMMLTMGFFAGVRSAEIHRARWCDLDLEAATLRIPQPKGFARGVRPRLIELEPCATAWFRYWKIKCTDTVCEHLIATDPHRFTYWKRHILSPIGISWGGADGPNNVMRHTYATMHVGAFRNASATALNMGHGHASAILEKHYRGIVAHAIAVKYWQIMP